MRYGFKAIDASIERIARRVADATHAHASPSTVEAGRAFASLADPVHRRPFVHTARSVIDGGGQRVRATERLDLASDLPLLIAWGTADTLIPVDHAYRAAGRRRTHPGVRLTGPPASPPGDATSIAVQSRPSQAA